MRRAATFALFTPMSKTVAGTRFRLDSSRLSKSARRSAPTMPCSGERVGDDVADAQSCDADPQSAEAVLLCRRDQVAVAVESHCRGNCAGRARRRRFAATGSTPTAHPRRARRRRAPAAACAGGSPGPRAGRGSRSARRRPTRRVRRDLPVCGGPASPLRGHRGWLLLHRCSCRYPQLTFRSHPAPTLDTGPNRTISNHRERDCERGVEGTHRVVQARHVVGLEFAVR